MKENTSLDVWNVRILYGSVKIYRAASELCRFKLDVMAISECRWKGAGEHSPTGREKLLFSECDLANFHRNGLACLLSRKALRSFLEWQPINERLNEVVQVLLTCQKHHNHSSWRIEILESYVTTNWHRQ